MMKISNEVKVGATAIITLILFIWLYNFLKGKDLFQNVVYYYTVYDEVGGLSESNPVEINGYKVGVVQSIEFLDATSGRLLASFSVGRDFKLPRNTVAEITPISPLGGMKVQFIYGNGPGFYEEGDTIPGRLAPSLFELIDKEILPLKDKISDLIVNLDSITKSIDEMVNEEFKEDLSGTIENLNSTTGSLKRIVGSKETDLKNSIENLNTFSRMLAENSEKMENTFTNLNNISDTLAAADIYGTVYNLKASLEKTSIALDNMNNGKGTAGQLMTNDTLYTNLSNSLESLNLLLTDMKANPKKYVHFSIFGKKQKDQ
ncbi:MAG TPA: MlaD family protein [Bacteroidales bacterium]|nr:MlaD family protein [Bacteroidales bacterium]